MKNYFDWANGNLSTADGTRPWFNSFEEDYENNQKIRRDTLLDPESIKISWYVSNPEIFLQLSMWKYMYVVSTEIKSETKDVNRRINCGINCGFSTEFYATEKKKHNKTQRAREPRYESFEDSNGYKVKWHKHKQDTTDLYKSLKKETNTVCCSMIVGLGIYKEDPILDSLK